MDTFCNKCGEPLLSGCEFCHKCGSPILKQIENQSATPVPKKSNVLKWVTAALALFLLIALVSATAFYHKYKVMASKVDAYTSTAPQNQNTNPVTDPAQVPPTSVPSGYNHVVTVAPRAPLPVTTKTPTIVTVRVAPSIPVSKAVVATVPTKANKVVTASSKHIVSPAVKTATVTKASSSAEQPAVASSSPASEPESTSAGKSETVSDKASSEASQSVEKDADSSKESKSLGPASKEEVEGQDDNGKTNSTQNNTSQTKQNTKTTTQSTGSKGFSGFKIGNQSSGTGTNKGLFGTSGKTGTQTKQNNAPQNGNHP